MKPSAFDLRFVLMLTFAASSSSGQVSHLSPLQHKGAGGITKEFLRNGVVAEVIPPSVSPEEKTAIDVKLARRLAVARAEKLWGGNPAVGSVIPLRNGVGELVAYDVDLDLRGDSWKRYEAIASDWQRILRERDQMVAAAASRDEAAKNVVTEKPNSKYASVTISATYDAYPIRAARRGVSNFYASAWVARGIAARVLGTPSPNLLTVIFLGPWERGYHFESAGRSIVVYGQAPWQWYEHSEYYDASRKELVTRKEDVFKKIRSTGLEPGRYLDSLGVENQSAIMEILNAPLSPSVVHYIPGYDTQIQPLDWHYGCTPTAAAMVLIYWDNRSGYGLLNGYYFMGADEVEGDLDCHIAQAQRDLSRFMGTYTSVGFTPPGNVYSGMKNYANSLGYSFSGGPDWVGDAIGGWHWDRMVEEIDAGYPFVFTYSTSTLQYHSVTVVGYDSETKDVMVYNTWDSDIHRVHYRGAVLETTYGVAPHPYGATSQNIKLTSLKGSQDYYSISTPTVFGRSGIDITWSNYGPPGHHVNLWYSTDGGISWQLIASPPDNGSYTWSIPNINTSHARVAIEQYSSASTLSASDGSYGNFRIVSSNVVVDTDPSGCTVIVDDQPIETPQGFQWGPGSTHTLTAFEYFLRSTKGKEAKYVWTSWSDGGARSHTITVPSSNIIYTAYHNTQYYLTITAGSGGSVGPVSAWYNSGQSVQISATPDSGHLFNWWTGSGEGSYTGPGTPASVTMNGPISETADFARGAWVQTNGPNGSIICFAQGGTNLFAAQSDGSVLLSTNNGEGWIKKSVVPDTNVRALAVSGANLIAGTYGGGMFCSTDSGTSWTAANTGLTNLNVTALSKGAFLFAGAYGAGVFYSTNNGSTWSQLYNQMGLTNKNVTTVAPHVGLRCFAGTFDAGVFYFNVLMDDWTAMNNGLTNPHIKALVLSGKDVYAGTEGGGVYVLPTAVTPWTWSPASKGLRNGSIGSLAVSGTNLFAVPSGSGVFLSTNEGTSWIPQNTGLTYLDVLSLTVSGPNLVAGVKGRGVWVRKISEIVSSIQIAPAIVPSLYALSQNYPNPFNPSTTIRYGLPERSHVSLVVFTTLGQQVTVLQNGEQEAGYHDVKFDASNLPSGVYFYRIQAGSYVKTKKLLLVR